MFEDWELFGDWELFDICPEKNFDILVDMEFSDLISIKKDQQSKNYIVRRSENGDTNEFSLLSDAIKFTQHCLKTSYREDSYIFVRLDGRLTIKIFEIDDLWIYLAIYYLKDAKTKFGTRDNSECRILGEQILQKFLVDTVHFLHIDFLEIMIDNTTWIEVGKYQESTILMIENHQQADDEIFELTMQEIMSKIFLEYIVDELFVKDGRYRPIELYLGISIGDRKINFHGNIESKEDSYVYLEYLDFVIRRTNKRFNSTKSAISS